MNDDLPLFGWSATARAKGLVAADACTEKAKRVANFDTEGAQAFVLAHLEKHGATKGEDLTAAAKAAGFVPHDDRAFGSVYQGLARRKKIKTVAMCFRAKGNGTAGGRVWALAEETEERKAG